MEEPSGIAALGINIHTLITQLVNFLILLFLLWLVAYKPILKMLRDREEKISNSLKMADINQKKADELEKQIMKNQEEARENAKKLLDESQAIAEKTKKEVLEKAQKESDELMKLAETKIKQQKDELRTELRAETAGLVVTALEKILDKKLDKDDEKKFIEEAVKEIK